MEDVALNYLEVLGAQLRIPPSFFASHWADPATPEFNHRNPFRRYCERNFVVRTFGKLSVTRSLNYAGTSVSHPAEASAVARRDNRAGSIQLWLASNTEVDMYE